MDREKEPFISTAVGLSMRPVCLTVVEFEYARTTGLLNVDIHPPNGRAFEVLPTKRSGLAAQYPFLHRLLAGISKTLSPDRIPPSPPHLADGWRNQEVLLALRSGFSIWRREFSFVCHSHRIHSQYMTS